MKTKIALLFPQPKATIGAKTSKHFVNLALKSAQMVKDKDTELIPCFPDIGNLGLEERFHHYLAYRAEKEMYEAMVQIGKQDFDAVMIGCWMDPGFFEGRQALDIPVVGAAQSSALFATMMGWKFSVITLTPLVIPQQIESVERYGLKDKLVSIRSVKMPLPQQDDALINARDLIEASSC